MALPNLPSMYSARKNVYEAALHNRREKEREHRHMWNQTANFFHDSDVKTHKQQRWESSNSFQHSMDAYKRQQDRELKVIKLQQRRIKLAALLDSEAKRYQKELESITPRNRETYNDLKDRCENLRTAREENRQQLANEKLYQHFRMNNPDLRELESRQFQKHVVGEWSGQEEEKKQEEAAQRLEEAALDAEMEAERKLALDLEKQLQQTQLEDERRLRLMQRQQMDELKEREAQAEQMKAQEHVLLKQQIELDQLEQRRKQMEAQRKKMEFGKVLLRQHAAALKRRSRQVQEELEQDLDFLARLAVQERQDEQLMTTRREKAKADAGWMQQVLEEQLQLEKAREAELDQMYQDEAARMWSDREAEWKRERVARERLMEEVLLGRQQQIRDHLIELQKQQEASLEQREQIIRDLELAEHATRREQAKEKEEREDRRRALTEQVTSRREASFAQQLQLQEKLEEERAAERAYGEMLRKEATRMDQQGYQPKNYGKRQAWS